MSFWQEIENHFVSTNDPISGEVDLIIGLGADVARGGQAPSPQSEAIARKAFELVHMTNAPRLLFTGGYAKGGPCIARLMATFIRQTFELTNHQIEILVETKSRNTVANVRNCFPIIKRFNCRNVVVVAQQWHARRVRDTWRKMMAGTDIKVVVIRANSPYGGGTQLRFAHWPAFLVWDTVALIFCKLRRYC